MKRYKLKKDLPTFRAGEEFFIDDGGNLVAANKYILAYSKSTLHIFPDILTEWFEEIPERPKTVWDLKPGDGFSLLEEDGCISYIKEWDGGLWSDEREVGNIFLTKKEAARELARRKAKQILLRDTNGYKPNLKDRRSPKHYVYYDIDGTSLVVFEERFCTEDRMYFASREDAKASIRAHRKEWLTYFGVEE